MFFSLSRVLVAALPVAAVLASPHEARTDGGQCNVNGGAKCCQNVGTAAVLDPLGLGGLGFLLGLLNLPITTILGTSCTNLVNIADCSAKPVCCQNNQFNGFVNIACNSISL
ncbi:hypothetical protein C8J57DRAFT_1567691 [Mycena rebaudengoi]|nr:hypothetical protein C8J57DRAFT_1567691 [Mycena rebaudengoi]